MHSPCKPLLQPQSHPVKTADFTRTRSSHPKRTGSAPQAPAGGRQGRTAPALDHSKDICSAATQQLARRREREVPAAPDPLRGRSPPVVDVNGGSSGLANTQPVCSSLGSSGRVRCQVGCVTDSPITSCKPCAPARHKRCQTAGENAVDCVNAGVQLAR